MSPNSVVEPRESRLEFLAWDSDFFGFRVGRLAQRNIDDSDLTSGLESARRENYRLIYWVTGPDRGVPDRLPNRTPVASWTAVPSTPGRDWMICPGKSTAGQGTATGY